MTPLFRFISNLYGVWNPVNENWETGKDLSSLVSPTQNISTLFDRMLQRFSNLLRIELMLIYEKIMFLEMSIG